MSPRDPVLDAMLRQARAKRLARAFDEALPLVDALCRRYPLELAARDEALRTELASGSPQHAFQRLGAAGQAGLDAPPPPDVAARLAVDLKLDLPLAALAQVCDARWLARTVSEGREPCDELQAASMELGTDGGRLVYTFRGPCPYCGHGQSVTLVVTLLTRRTWLCAACLGRVGFDHDSAGRFLRARCGDLVDRPFAELEAPLAERVRQRVVGELPAPEAVEALGQGYQFLLNEIAVRLALGGDEEAKGGRP